MIDPELLKILCCPETHQPLALAEPGLVQRLNQQIDSGQLRNRAGQPVTRKCDGGLVRQDGQFVYPVCQNIPILLINEAIPLSGQIAAQPR
jgi:uncharacterized protein YbaR (Trm112 family)